MKSFLLKTLVWGGLLFPWGTAKTQPIQLIPEKEAKLPAEPLPEASFSPSSPAAHSVWKGTPLSLVEAYFPKIPIHLTSPSLRSLRSKILNESYGSLGTHTLYENMRLSLLIATGNFEKAREALSEPPFPHKETFLLDLHWLRGEKKKACEKIANLMLTSPLSEWKEENIYCLYVNGEEERGKIALELLAESNTKNVRLLSSLFDHTLRPPFDPRIGLSPFLLTVWAETGEDIPEEDLALLSPSSLALIARLEGFPLKTRLSAGEKAVEEGSLTPQAFLTFFKEEASDTLLQKFRIAFQDSKLEDLLPLFEDAFQEGRLGFIGKVFHADLFKIEPTLETLPLAPYLIRTFLSSGDMNLAQKWASFYLREAPDEAIPLLPLLHLAFPQIPWGEPQMQAWYAYQMRINPATAPRNSSTLRRLFKALEISYGSEIKEEPPPLSWRQEKALFEGNSLELLEAAVDSHRRGEGLLLVLTLIGKTPLQDLPPNKLARLLHSLVHLGYPAEAHALALEYLLKVEGHD